jgi:hypothetical protein
VFIEICAATGARAFLARSGIGEASLNRHSCSFQADVSDINVRAAATGDGSPVWVLE